MRVLQLDLSGHRVEFHPYVTVLRGVDADLHAELIEALVAVSTGKPSVEGLVEAHGVVLDLTDTTLELLDLPGPSDVDIVVRREELPGNTAAGSGGRAQIERARAEAADRVARAEANADRAAVALEASREASSASTAGSGSTEGGARLEGPNAELTRLIARRTELESAAEEARLAHVRAQQEQDIADERIEQARRLRAESARACSVAAGALESARTVRDPFATTALEAARERLAILEAEATRTGEVGPRSIDNGFDDPVAELERLEGRRLELEAALLALDTVDPFPVEVSLTQLTSADTEGELVVSEEAIRMADEFASITRTLGTDPPEEPTSGSAIAIARRRLDAARAAVFDAERAVRIPEVDRIDIEDLENAHEHVLMAQDRSDKRLSGGRAKQRLDEVRELEQAILNRLGYVTYAEFVMGTSIVPIDPEHERRLEIARADLASAEDVLSDLEADVDAELARAELVARRRSLRLRAVSLLGRDPGEDVEWALRHHRVRGHDGSGRADRLHEALEGAGVMIGDEEMPPELLIEIAKIWLDEQSETSNRREVLGQELAALDARLSVVNEAARVRRGAPSADDVAEEAHERAARKQAQLEEARSIVRTAEQRLVRQAQVEFDVAERKADLESAIGAEGAVASAMSVAEAEADAAAQAEQAAAAERSRREGELAAAVDAARQATDTVVVSTPGSASVEELEWYLLSRVAAQRSVSYAGSVPLVLDDALADVRGGDLVRLLSRLERMSTAVQVIVVSEDNQVAAWADSVGADRAMTLYPLPV